MDYKKLQDELEVKSIKFMNEQNFGEMCQYQYVSNVLKLIYYTKALEDMINERSSEQPKAIKVHH